jgi:hypothetical protein
MSSTTLEEEMRQIYELAIYTPEDREHPEVSFESETPFMPMSVGDLINPIAWNLNDTSGRVLKVVSVKHMIYTRPDQTIKHAYSVLTENVTDPNADRWTATV